MRLDGKSAIVTGGASGFGRGIAKKFVSEGARVVVADVVGDAAAKAAKEIGAEAFTLDVSSAQGWAEIEATHGTPDILVNNAGITHLPAPMETIEEDEFDRVLAVNAKSVYLAARTFNSAMKKRGSGNILNIASTAPQSQLVQCLQGLDDHGHQSHGRGIGPVRHSSERALSGCRRNTPSQILYGGRHTRDARQVHLNHSDGSLFDSRGHGQCRLLSLLG
jgi:threonine dehydrogenase-like Zn-dependent dehydrogenase